MIFICPHCEQKLQIRPQFLGFRGYCKKCGGRIALIGSRNMLTAQRAQPLPPRVIQVAESVAGSANVFESTLDAALESISGWDDEVVTDFEDESESEAPPTEDQIRRLRELGATEGQLARLATKGDAIRMIEVLQPPPTEEQIAILRSYGVTDDELSFLTTQGVAQAMIDEYESDDDIQDEDADDEDLEDEYVEDAEDGDVPVALPAIDLERKDT